MTLQQQQNALARREHRKRNAKALAARYALDTNAESDEVLRELLARAVVAPTTAKEIVTPTPIKITLITPPKVTTSTPAKVTSAASVSAKVTAASASSASSVSSVASTASVSSTSALVPSTSTTISTPSSILIPSTTRDRALPLTTSDIVPNPTVSHHPVNTKNSDSSATSSSGIRTTTLIGIIAGAVGAILVICMIAGFFLRRLRTKRKGLGGAEVFDPAEFRRSAVLLDEKDGNGNNASNGKTTGSSRPRPPTMIERHVNNGTPVNGPGGSVPPMPSMAYGHQQASFGQYGGANVNGPNNGVPPPTPGAMYNGLPVVPPPGPYGAHYDQAGYGAPPVPGTYAPGAYAPYQGQFQQQQQQQQQRYPYQQHPGGYQGQGQGQGQGHLYPTGYAPVPQHPHPHQLDMMNLNANVPPNAFSGSSVPPSPVVSDHRQGPIPALRLASSSTSSSSSASSSDHGHKSDHHHHPDADDDSAPPPAYVDETGEGGKYHRDVKMKPVQLNPPTSASASGSSSTISGLSSSNSGATQAQAPATTTTTTMAAKRTSAYSVYDQDDVYGGI